MRVLQFVPGSSLGHVLIGQVSSYRDTAFPVGQLAKQGCSWVLWWGLIAATLPREVVCLWVVAFPGAALAQSYWTRAVCMGAIVFEHVLRDELIQLSAGL